MPDPAPSERRLVRFGSFEVDFQSAELRKAGRRIPLQEKPFRLLQALLGRPGELVTREQLQRELWSDDTFVDFERGLNTAVKRMRDAIGDDAETPRFVETLPRRGYRFIGPVVEGDAETSFRSREVHAPTTWFPRPLVLVGAAVALAVVSAIAMLSSAPRSSATWAGVARLQVPVEPAERFGSSGRTVGGTKTNLALSPDGRTLVYVGTTGETRQLYARRLDQDAAVAIPGTSGAMEPFMSPDGAWIGFWADGYLRRVAVDGGQAAKICAVDQYPPMGATWVGSDVVFARAQGPLLKVPASGGTPVPVTTLRPGEFGHRLPHALRASRTVLFTVRKRDYTWGNEEIAAQSLDGGARTTLVAGTDARYASSGHLVFMRLGTLLAAPFDAAALKLTGAPVPIVNDVAESAAETSTQTASGAGQFAMSDTGVLAFVRGGLGPPYRSRLLWLDRHGAVSALDLPVGSYVSPHLSPDGRRIAWFSWETTGSSIWVHDLERGWSARLPSEDEDSWPIWSPDGRDVVYQSVSHAEWFVKRRHADGTGAPSVIASGASPGPTSWSFDGTTLAMTVYGKSTAEASQGDIYTWRAGDRPRPLIQSAADEGRLEFSPASPHYAYASDDAGQMQVYVAAIDRPAERVRVSTSGGDAPAWTKGGHELIYVAPGSSQDVSRVMAVEIATEPTVRVGLPRLLFESREANVLAGAHPGRNYDVTPNGERILTAPMQPPQIPAAHHIDVVLNWQEGLQRPR
jgi:serine/threonine-protein kinase